MTHRILRFNGMDDDYSILDWRVFDQNIGIFGAVGGGKTERAKKIIKQNLQNVKLWIYDFSNRFDGYGKRVTTVDELDGQYQYVLQAKDKTNETFNKFCDKIFFTQSNIVGVFDELQQYLSKQSINQHFNQLVLSGRNKGICGIFISPSPSLIPNYVLGNIHHVYAYKMTLRTQIDWLKENFIGDKAELLLPPDKRKILKDQPMLGEYSCIYRDQNKDDSAILGG